MSTKIEWTNYTWNMVTGCNKVSPGCRSCYAEVMHRRLSGIESQKEKYSRPFNDGAFPYAPALEEPFLIKKPSMFFSPSMSDLFHENIPMEYIAKVWAVMYINYHHTFQVLTKRAERLLILNSPEFHKIFIKEVDHIIKNYDLPDSPLLWYKPGSFRALPPVNVWLGVSCEDQQHADERIPFLLKTPAAIRFLSCEPLIGPINLLKSKRIFISRQVKSDPEFSKAFDDGELTILKQNTTRKYIGPDWVICGGESGRNARPMHPNWVRSLRDQCKDTDVPFFFKQWGEYSPYLHSYTGKEKQHFVSESGHFQKNAELVQDDNWQTVFKTGKSKADNYLDGKQHLNFPTV